MLAGRCQKYFRQILQLKQFFPFSRTVLLLDDRSAGARDLQIESIAHGVISLCRSSLTMALASGTEISKKSGASNIEGNLSITSS